jgi:hypothetical protein
MRLMLFSHFHRAFSFPENCDWVTPTVFEKNKIISKNQICLSEFSPNISEVILESGTKVDPTLTQDKIGYYSQTLATEYWILHHVNDIDYVGVTGYRRYPFYSFNRSDASDLYSAPATAENLNVIFNNQHISTIKSILNVYDVIVSREIFTGHCVSKQFLVDQNEEVWELFIEAISSTLPELRPYLKWFDLQSHVSYLGPIGFVPLNLFKDYADSYIKILRFMMKNLDNPFHINGINPVSSSDRWIGFLAERFFPFYIFANKISKFGVPTVILKEV